MMFKPLMGITRNLENIFQEHSHSSTPLEVRNLITRFTIDVIGSLALGIECNSIKNPESNFKEVANILMENMDTRTTVRYLIASCPKWLMMLCETLFKKQLANFDFIQPPVQEFFKNVVKETVAYREKNNISRNDFLHLLLLLKNKGSTKEVTDLPLEAEKASDDKLTMKEIIAQCFLFFFAGYDTTSTVLTAALYELARYPEIQEKLREEIHRVLSESEGELSYGNVLKMNYLDAVFSGKLSSLC